MPLFKNHPELRALALSIDADNDYEAITPKRSQRSRLACWVQALRNMYTGLLWVCVGTIVLGIMVHLVESLQQPDQPQSALPDQPLRAGGNPGLRGNGGVLSVSALQAWEERPAGEIADVATSRYNHDYFCTVKRAAQAGPGEVALDFVVVGDWSLGKLQEPLASRLSWDGGYATPAHHRYEVDDIKHEFVEGTLYFDAVPPGKELSFTFGSGGYSTVRLPLVLQPLGELWAAQAATAP